MSLLGEFISNITYGNSNIEIPNEVVRILTTLNRKENGKRMMRSAPLRVIEDAPETQPSRRDSTTNLTQRVTNLFRMPSHPDLAENKIGRTLSDKEKEGLLSRLRGNNNRRESADTTGNKPLLKSSQSSYELISGSTQSTNSLPLDSNGVHISYEGTTKLKSIHPLRSRNTLNSIPILSDRQAQVELKIIEKDDEITNKIKATMNKVTNLFDSDHCIDKNGSINNDKLSVQS